MSGQENRRAFSLAGVEEGDSCAVCIELEALIQTRRALGAAAAPPAFDRTAVEAHVSLLHDLAEGIDGVLILAAFEEGGQPRVQRFRIGDVAGMVETIMGSENHQNLNLYTPWSVFRRDLERGKKGREADVVAVLAAVPDLDNDKYTIGELPFEAPYIVESSPGNFQPVYIFERPLPPGEAKPVLTALSDFIGGDSGTKDCSHVWRIPGTLNIPTKSKLARGRNAAPATVAIKKAYDGGFVSPAALLALAPPPQRPNGHDTTPHGPLSFAEEHRLRGALKAILPDDRDIWLKVGAALHLVGARAVWDDWSKASGKFDAADQDRVWASFHGARKEGVVTIGTIYAWAKERGWVPSVNAHDPAPAADTKVKALAALAMISSAKALQHEVFQPMKYAVKGYVVEGVTILAGRPKIGKSWLALDWNGAIARGGFCFGDLHCIEGAILYLALEDNKRRLKSRLNKLFGSAEWPENFEYATEWPTAKEGGIAAIRAWVKSRPSARAVTVDVLERFRTRSRSGNENAYAADYETIKELQALASELNIAILVITHLRKGGDGDDPIEKISGTLGLSGGADAFLILDGNSNGQTLYGRGRDLEEFTKAVRFNRETCRWEILGEAAEVKRSDERSRILDALKEADTAMTPLQIAAEAGLRRGNVRFLLGKMVADGEVLKGGRGKYAHPDTPEFLPSRPARKPKQV